MSALHEVYENPFLTWLGCGPLRSGGGHCEVDILLQPHLLNSWKVCHGGVLMTLLDASMGAAARSLHPEKRVCATVDMTSSFMQPGSDERLYARSRCLHRSTTMAFCEGEIRDTQDRLIARATGTFKYIKK